jgi:phage host-nuclease inhibitor protein Gam
MVNPYNVQRAGSHTMIALLDQIACQIEEYTAQIEYHQREIACLNKRLRELRWQAVDFENGEITFYDDVA